MTWTAKEIRELAGDYFLDRETRTNMGLEPSNVVEAIHTLCRRIDYTNEILDRIASHLDGNPRSTEEIELSS